MVCALGLAASLAHTTHACAAARIHTARRVLHTRDKQGTRILGSYVRFSQCGGRSGTSFDLPLCHLHPPNLVPLRAFPPPTRTQPYKSSKFSPLSPRLIRCGRLDGVSLRRHRKEVRSKAMKLATGTPCAAPGFRHCAGGSTCASIKLGAFDSWKPPGLKPLLRSRLLFTPPRAANRDGFR